MPFWRDRSFSNLLERCPALESLRDFLPPALGTPAYQEQERIEAVPSSYRDHGYGNFFYALVRTLKPETCVELGVLHGFSLLSAAAALRDNGSGMIRGIDKFEDYRYRHAKLADVETHIRACTLAEWSIVARADANLESERYQALDYLHVDLSNDGDTYRSVFKHWAGRVKQAIVLEGGSPERDRVEWMVKFGKPPIVPAIDEIRRDYPDWIMAVLAPYPSLTLALRIDGIRNELPHERS